MNTEIKQEVKEDKEVKEEKSETEKSKTQTNQYLHTRINK